MGRLSRKVRRRHEENHEKITEASSATSPSCHQGGNGTFNLKGLSLLRYPEFFSYPNSFLQLLNFTHAATPLPFLSEYPLPIHSLFNMSSKPTLVLVPGAWHNASTWDKVSSLMAAQQYKCISVALPSTMSDPSATLLQDIEAVRDSIVDETIQGRDVVVVVHSYGGMVGESAIKRLTRHKQDGSSSEKDPSGSVIGIVMLATGFVQTGVSFIDGTGGKPPPFWTIDPESGFATLVVEPRQLFYHDLPEEEGDYWVQKLGNQSLKSLMEGGEHAYAGWMDVPVWYVATTEDKALPVQAQRAFVQGAKDAGADVTLREVESSHSPMLSRPKQTADFILEAVTAFVG